MKKKKNPIRKEASHMMASTPEHAPEQYEVTMMDEQLMFRLEYGFSLKRVCYYYFFSFAFKCVYFCTIFVCVWYVCGMYVVCSDDLQHVVNCLKTFCMF